MPGGSGPELYERLHSQYPDLKVLFMSGYVEGAGKHREILDQGHHLLPKPFRPTQLGAKVREILEGSAPRLHTEDLVASESGESRAP